MAKANKIVMAIAGLVLIIASVLKSHQLLTEPIISKTFWESWLFFVIQIPLELGLGIWLLSGLFRKAAWLIAVFAFGMFILITLQKGLTGVASCGCFGRVSVNPWITLSIMDIPFFALLLIFRPKGQKLIPHTWPSAKHFFSVAVPTSIILPLIVLMLVFNKPPEKTETYEVVKPDQWITEKPTSEQTAAEQPTEDWPMLKHIDIADSIRSGITVVFFYRHDCSICHEAIPIYDQMARDLSGDEDGIKIAFIEIPPYGPEHDSPIPSDTPALTGKLDAAKEWFITTPLVVIIWDAAVIKSWEVQTPQLDEILNTVFAEGS